MVLKHIGKCPNTYWYMLDNNRKHLDIPINDIILCYEHSSLYLLIHLSTGNVVPKDDTTSYWAVLPGLDFFIKDINISNTSNLDKLIKLIR